MSVRPRGRASECRDSRSPDEVEVVDRYLRALDTRQIVDATMHADLERGFIEQARHFGQSRGISFGAWRDVGVPADVLACAGIHPDGRS